MSASPDSLLAFRCPACGQSLKARLDLAGRRIRCAGCRSEIQIPDSNRTTALPAGEVPGAGSEAHTRAFSPGTVSPVEEITTALLQLPGYEILGELGRGAMGIVYRARQTALDRQVAIKVVQLQGQSTGAALARFEMEARSLAKLRHPNIVIAHDLIQHDGQLCFVMELLDGEDLERRLDRLGPVEEELVWRLLRQAAAGLAHAQQQGLIHRDIKPANLLLVAPPEGFTPGQPLLKITDFGLVLLREEENAARLTATGTVVGTPIYMAPEQFTSASLDCRADIYGLGASACHMLSGQLPYGGRTVWEIMAEKVSNHSFPIPGSASVKTRALLLAMLEPDPTRRVGSYEELLQRMDAILRSSTAATIPVPKQPSPERTRQRGNARRARRWSWVLGPSLMVAAAVVGIGWWFWPGIELMPPPPASGTGQILALYDGTNLLQWTFARGLWRRATDDEGGTVLAGAGVARRLLPRELSPPFRLSFGVNLRDARAVEVHFGVAEASSRSCWILHLSKEEVFLGEGKGDTPALRRLTPVQRPRERIAGASPYQAIKLERRDQRWYGWLGEQYLGSLPVRLGETPELGLATEGGPAHFESLQVEGLRQE